MRCKRRASDAEVGDEIGFVLLNRLLLNFALNFVPPETWARFGAPFFSVGSA
jgi:hypothetical protein